MKKLLLMCLLAAGSSRLKAQQLTCIPQPEGLKSITGKPMPIELNKKLQEFKPDTLVNNQLLHPMPGIDLKLLSPMQGEQLYSALYNREGNITMSPVDHMPIIITGGNSKMPVAKFNGNDKMTITPFKKDSLKLTPAP